jgi:hypothetical protein
MNNWPPEFRLKLIAALAARNIGAIDPQTDPSWHAFAERVLFLANMPDEFLADNEKNFIDVIRWAAEEE